MAGLYYLIHFFVILLIYFLIPIYAIRNGKRKIWGIIGIVLAVICTVLWLYATWKTSIFIITSVYMFALVAAEGWNKKNIIRNLCCVAMAITVAAGGFALCITVGNKHEVIYDFGTRASVLAYNSEEVYVGGSLVYRVDISEANGNYYLTVYTEESLPGYSVDELTLWINGKNVAKLEDAGDRAFQCYAYRGEGYGYFSKEEIEEIRELLDITDSYRRIEF